MNLKETNQKLERINLEKETKESILDLIDTKTDSDMKEVLNAIGALKNEINTFDHKLETSIGALNGKLDTSIGALNDKLDTSIGALKRDLNTKFDSSIKESSNLKWFIGLAVTIATLIIKYLK